MADHHHKVFNSNDYIPKRFGLNYSPPQIIIEYLAPSTGKLYHHKMRLHKFNKEKNNAEIIKELYERHQVYLDKKKVSSEQLLKLIERLKQNFSRRVHRYVVIKRGFRFYIHDERNCADIMMFRYTEANHDEILEHVNNMCDDLNQGNINFIGRKYRCD